MNFIEALCLAVIKPEPFISISKALPAELGHVVMPTRLVQVWGSINVAQCSLSKPNRIKTTTNVCATIAGTMLARAA